MKKIVLILLLCIAATASWAAKVSPLPATIIQPDGTQLTVMGYGDEDLHWYTTTDGVLLAQKGKAFYIATVTVEGELVATNQIAHEKSVRGEAERRLARAQDKDLFYRTNPFKKRLAQIQRIGINDKAEPRYFPRKGSPRALVILAQFADEKFTVTDPYQTFTDYLNSEQPLQNRGYREDRNYGSVRQYFSDMSGGVFKPQFDVYGPITLPQNMAYYGQGYKDLDSRIDSLIKHCCEAVDGMVDFSQYDSDNDGYADLVYVIYAGFGENTVGNSTDCIWPKAGTNITSRYYDGVKVKRYGVGNELNYTPTRVLSEDPQRRVNGIGLFCHEFSHTLGLPDLYPTSGDATKVDNQAMEYWDLMDYGEYTDNGYTPTPYTPWEREVMGWVKHDTLKTAAQVTLHENEAYTIIHEGSEEGEYVMVHNIQNKGWASRLLGHGMLVYRIDYQGRTSVNLGDKPNNIAGQPGMTIVPADGLLISGYRIVSEEKDITTSHPYTVAQYQSSHFGDPYPGSENVQELTSIKLNHSTMNKGLYNIKEENTGTETVVKFAFLDANATDIVDSRATDGIRTVAREHNNAIYDMQGRRIAAKADKTTNLNLPKGIYIIGGRKVVVK